MTIRSLCSRIVRMDTYAQRTILNARAVLVAGLAPTLGYDEDERGIALAARMGHGLTDRQALAIADVATALQLLVLDDADPPACPTCCTPLIQPATGRPKTFCSDACRQQQARVDAR